MNEGKSIRFSRWCYEFATGQRKVVPFVLSKEVFARLVDDFREILCEMRRILNR